MQACWEPQELAHGDPRGVCAEEGRTASVYQASSNNKGSKIVKLSMYMPRRYMRGEGV